MAPLTSAQRKRLSSQEFIFPKERAYPIDTANRARNALSRGAQNLSPAKEAKVERAVKARYPSISVEGSPAKHRADRAERRCKGGQT